MFDVQCWASISAWRFSAYCGQPVAVGGGTQGRVVHFCWEFEQINTVTLELREKCPAGTP